MKKSKTIQREKNNATPVPNTFRTSLAAEEKSIETMAEKIDQQLK
jgi:hypothetical protein